MEFDHDDVRLAVTEDRLSSLPDELIHQILSRIDTKFAVQTCLLSSRWKLIWKSVPCLDFSSREFDSLPKFAKFVNHVLSDRNHQIEVSSVNLGFNGAASQVFVRKIAKYAFSHNVQELTIRSFPKRHHEFPSCLFTSQTLKHLTFSAFREQPCYTPKTPWDFPALTTLYLHDISLCDDNRESFDLFSKCVNLKNLTLKRFIVVAEVFDIITPQLSNLVLIDGRRFKVITVIAPQLENLTVMHCWIKMWNAPPSLSSMYYGGPPPQLSKDCFHSLNKVTLHFDLCRRSMPYEEKDAHETINMLQELHSARYLTLNLDIVECLSSFPDLLSHLPSPFSNLICINIDSGREEPYKVKISTETRNFFLENSPNAKFITDLPEEPPTKAMIAKQAREKKRAKLISDIESHMKDLQALLEQENRLFSVREQAKGKTKAVLENLMPEIQQLLTRKKMLQCDPGQAKESVKIEKVVGTMKDQMLVCMKEMHGLNQQVLDDVIAIDSKKVWVKSRLESLPKRQRADIEARYSRQFEEIETVFGRLSSTIRDTSSCISKAIDSFKKFVSDKTSTFQDVSSSKLPPSSQPPSPSAVIPTSLLQVSTPCGEPPAQGC